MKVLREVVISHSGFDQFQSSCFWFSFIICGWQDFCPPTEISPEAIARPPTFAPPAPPFLHTSGPFHLAFSLPCPWQGHLGLWNWKLILRPSSHRLLGPGCGKFPASSLQTESHLSGQLPQWVQKTVSSNVKWFPFFLIGFIYFCIFVSLYMNSVFVFPYSFS